MTGRSYIEAAILATGLVAAVGSGVWAYRSGGPYGEKFSVDPRVRKTYDARGRVSVVAFDASGDLVFDTWSYFDGDRLIRMDFDDDQDGLLDRRRFFNADGSIERTQSLREDTVPAPAAPNTSGFTTSK